MNQYVRHAARTPSPLPSRSSSKNVEIPALRISLGNPQRFRRPSWDDELRLPLLIASGCSLTGIYHSCTFFCTPSAGSLSATTAAKSASASHRDYLCMPSSRRSVAKTEENRIQAARHKAYHNSSPTLKLTSTNFSQTARSFAGSTMPSCKTCRYWAILDAWNP